MKKIIKLTEKDLRNITKKVIFEQSLLPDNAGYNDKPLKDKNVEPYPLPDNAGKKEVNPINIAKLNVKKNLHDAAAGMNQLMKMSGVNPQTNNIVDDIEKVIEKFDNLYGDPKPQNKEENV